MNETPMHTVLDASDFAQAELRQPANAPDGKGGGAPLPWRLYARCVFLFCIIMAVLYMTYRPSLLRLSILMSLVAPSRGDNLAWRPEPEEEIRPPAARRTPSPPGWRLTATHAVNRSPVRPAPYSGAYWRGGRLSGATWGRSSDNPWNWTDDMQTSLRRKDDPLLTPAQKPVSAFRTTDNAAWAAQAGIGPDVPASLPAAVAPAGGGAGVGLSGLPSLPGLNIPMPTSTMSASAAALSAVPPRDASDGGDAVSRSRVPDLPLPPSPLGPIPPLAAVGARPSAPSAATSTAPSTAPSAASTAPTTTPAPPAALSPVPDVPAAPAYVGAGVNVFQLPPLPSNMTQDKPVDADAAMAGDLNADGAVVFGNAFPSGDGTAPSFSSTLRLPATIGETRSERRLDASPPVSLPDAAEPAGSAAAPLLSAVPQTPAATEDDPFAVGGIIVSTPITLPVEAAAPAPDRQPASRPEPIAPTGSVATSGFLRPVPETSGVYTSTPAQTAEPTQTVTPAQTAEPTQTVEPARTTAPIQTAEPEKPDWKNREITAAIPGAYLTIYPKLKFIGLCVPGQGYIRKYNQVAAPMDFGQEKVHAADGRTPYGKYYIAGHRRDASGPRLLLSWPSVDDARRIGLGTELLAEVESAWQRQSLPPQDTAAGGGVALTGGRERLEATSGGFALEEPHMEEIFTALPDGAWVFIQP